MAVYQMRNMKCFCVSGKYQSYVSQSMPLLNGSFLFMEIIFLLTLYLYTIQHLKKD